MHNAWRRLITDGKAEHHAESIDEFDLENRVLTEDERRVLHKAIVTFEKEKLDTQHLEAGEGSGVGHHDTSSETPMPTQPEPTPTVDPLLCLLTTLINRNCLWLTSTSPKESRLHPQASLRKVFRTLLEVIQSLEYYWKKSLTYLHSVIGTAPIMPLQTKCSIKSWGLS